MTLENIKNEIYLQLEILFAEAEANELSNDIDGFKEDLEKIAKVAKALDVHTTITKFNINLEKSDQKK